MATLPYDRERWMVRTFGGGKRSQLCGQYPVFPPLKRPKTGLPSINGGHRFNGFPIDYNPSSINIPRYSPQISHAAVDTISALLAINSCQNPFPAMAINPGFQHERQANIVGPVPPAATTLVMPTVQGPQAPILGLVNPPPLSSPVQEILKTQPSNSQVKSDSLPLPPPPLPLSGTAIVELLNYLAKRGLIKPTEEIQTQPEPEPEPEPAPIGLEFDPALLKKRHESVINALYSDMPRQCSTCGLRFKTSGEHSRHMDWHVRKNQAKKNRRGKPLRLSRPWFPSSDEEPSPAIPESWLYPEENLNENKVDELLIVHADYDQKLCALCNEAFEDFYCDSTEDWMYKGAVYMKARNGELGPIVHAKCLPEPPV
ncbi:hypothetical protein SLE2022_063230 [Rubroshorea leprosula]